MFPEELFLRHYLDISRWNELKGDYMAILREEDLVWDPLDRIGLALDEILRSKSYGMDYSGLKPVSLRGGEIEGTILVEERAEIEPFVVIKAEKYPVFIGRKAKIMAFSRIEARDGEIYINDGTTIGSHTSISGNGVISSNVTISSSSIRGKFFIGEGTSIQGSFIDGPAFIGSGSEIRPGSLIRPNSFLGNGIEFRSECKNSIILDGSRASHYSYIGDSIIGFDVNLGAGTKTGNLRIDGEEVRISLKGRIYRTGRRKFGAIIGDGTHTGCLVMFNPGTLVGPRSLIYPSMTLRGYYPPESIVKPEG